MRCWPAFATRRLIPGPVRDVTQLITAVLDGQVNWVAFAVGASTLAAILLLKRFHRVPGLLLAVMGATVAVGVRGLDQGAAVKVLGPLPQVRMIPTGGVSLETAADFIRAGAGALGIGSTLGEPKAVAAGDFGRIESLARQYVRIVQETRAAMKG